MSAPPPIERKRVRPPTFYEELPPAEPSLTANQRREEALKSKKEWELSYKAPNVKPVNLTKELVLGTAEGEFHPLSQVRKSSYNKILASPSTPFPSNITYGAPTLKGSGKRNKKSTKAKKTKKAKKAKKTRKQTQKRRV